MTHPRCVFTAPARTVSLILCHLLVWPLPLFARTTAAPPSKPALASHYHDRTAASSASRSREDAGAESQPQPEKPTT